MPSTTGTFVEVMQPIFLPDGIGLDADIAQTIEGTVNIDQADAGTNAAKLLISAALNSADGSGWLSDGMLVTGVDAVPADPIHGIVVVYRLDDIASGGAAGAIKAAEARYGRR